MKLSEAIANLESLWLLHYELEFMPQMLIPVKVRADEIKQDFVESVDVE